MRPLKRNQQTFWYAPLAGKDALTDNAGVTGQFGPIYADPRKWKGNLAPATGGKTTRQFGETLDYDEALVPEPGHGIDEHCVLWWGCDRPPVKNADGSFTPPWTHEVKKVARSLNGDLIALRRVHVR